ncbi:tyrosine-type recombinase/integrase [Nocardioidaceae bacterium SCSIO 66511]|nr:tyrosine-type recombinase/integrase [Nocardioidaceae bacterium SCSIO 66511]
MAQAARRRRARGSIEELPSGALRVSVYAGIDPVTKRRLYLKETVPSGPRAAQAVEKVRTRLQNQVDERRNPRTLATVGQLIDKYMGVVNLARSTRRGYESKIRTHISPLLGSLPLTRLDAEVLDSFYAELRRCRDHCDGKPYLQHRTAVQHECDEHAAEVCAPPDPASCRACRRACKPHACSGLDASSVLQIHWILSGALKRARAWKWISVNPVEDADAPSRPQPDPQPPSAEEAARLVEAAWRSDPDWGAFVWTKMTIGARRGEMCALRWNHVDMDKSLLTIRRSVYVERGEVLEKDTKTHQQRRIVLDPETAHVLSDMRERARDRLATVGSTLASDAYVFSSVPDATKPLLPDSASQRYKRMADRLGINTTLKNLRHYSATELIHAGVDARIVAGRLGHGGGGATTLRVYTAWSAEADQRAAGSVTARMPPRPAEASAREKPGTAARADELTEEDATYTRIAADLHGAIRTGILSPGDELPTAKALAAQYGVVPSTAHRAIASLADAGLVKTARGKRAVLI